MIMAAGGRGHRLGVDARPTTSSPGESAGSKLAQAEQLGVAGARRGRAARPAAEPRRSERRRGRRSAVVLGDRDGHPVLDRVTGGGVGEAVHQERERERVAVLRRCSSRRGSRRRAASRSCRGSALGDVPVQSRRSSVPVSPATASESTNAESARQRREHGDDVTRATSSRQRDRPEPSLSLGWIPKLVASCWRDDARAGGGRAARRRSGRRCP